jgi:hypothetical protein
VLKARAIRTPVAGEPLLDGKKPDYADAFEIHLAVADQRSAEQWVRLALEGAAAPVRWVIVAALRGVLRLKLDRSSGPGYVFGWRIISSAPDVIVLEADGPVLRGVLVGRRRAPTVTAITSLIFYRHRVARPLWALVAPIHRRVARYLLERVATPVPSD